VIERALARWGLPKPSPDDVVSQYVDKLYPPRTAAWYREWGALMSAVLAARRRGIVPRPAA